MNDILSDQRCNLSELLFENLTYTISPGNNLPSYQVPPQNTFLTACTRSWDGGWEQWSNYSLCARGLCDDVSVHVALLVHLYTGEVVQVHLLIGKDWEGGVRAVRNDYPLHTQSTLV